MAKKNTKAAEQALLTALAFGATVENAARKAGMGERTVYRRLADPAFRARLEQARLDAVLRTAGMLTGAALRAVQKARAIGYLAGIARKAIETGTLAARLEMLEAVLRQRKDSDQR